jgi:heavy metal sensor kinase
LLASWFSSIRVRLTVWYTAFLLLTLSIFALGVHSFFLRTLEARQRVQLRSILDVVATSIRHEIDEHGGRVEGEKSFAEVMQTLHKFTFPQHSIAVYTQGRLVGAHAAAAVPLPSASTAKVGDFAYAEDHGISQATTAIEVPQVGAVYQLAVAESKEHMVQDAQLLANAFVVLIPLMALPAMLGGYLLARRSLAPVVSMADAAARFSAETLEQRLEVRNPRDELGHLASTFNALLARLALAFTRQRSFMADASHELRTPVSISLTTAQTVLSAPHRSEADYRDALSTIERQMRRISRIVADLLLLAKADVGQLPLHRESVYLEDVLDEVAASARVLAGRASVELDFEPAPEIQLQADPQLLAQLLMNLLDNAIRASAPGQRVNVLVSTPPGWLEIRICDRGPGIPAEQLPHVFERFYTTRRQEGTGLGLAIARYIAESHGGHVTIESSSPEGTRLLFSVPYSATASSSTASSSNYGHTA